MSARKRRGLPLDHASYPYLAAVAVIVMLIRAALTVGAFNHTIDEPFHMAAAMGLYDAHKHIADVTHPPVAWLVAGLPGVLHGADVPSLHGAHTVMNFAQIDAVANQALFAQPQSYWRLLMGARLAMLVFPVIAMFYLYRLGQWLTNSLVAMLAVVFFSTDPTLLAHSALVNNDVAACAAYLAASYHGLRWIVRPSMHGAIVAGIIFGLALATKFTVVLVFPGLLLVLLLRPMRVFFNQMIDQPIHAYLRRWPSLSQFIVCAMVGFVAVWSTYLFDLGRLGDQTFFNYTPKFDSLPASLRNATIPMPSFFLGFLYQAVHADQGHESFLNGVIYHKGPKLFYPESLAFKEPLGFLVAFVAAVGIWLFMKKRRIWIAGMMLVPSLVYFAAVQASSVMIGVRHLLPILPIMYLFTCFVLARARLAWLVPVLAVLAFIETVAVHPDYIAFTNIAAGGPRQAGNYFADSNLDWGQDVARLATWLKTDPAASGKPYTLQVYASSLRPLLEELGLNPQTQGATPHGIFAISQSAKVGYHNFDPDRVGHPQVVDYSWLKNYRKIADIGYTIEVYDLGEMPSTSVASRRR